MTWEEETTTGESLLGIALLGGMVAIVWATDRSEAFASALGAGIKLTVAVFGLYLVILRFWEKAHAPTDLPRVLDAFQEEDPEAALERASEVAESKSLDCTLWRDAKRQYGWHITEARSGDSKRKQFYKRVGSTKHLWPSLIGHLTALVAVAMIGAVNAEEVNTSFAWIGIGLNGMLGLIEVVWWSLMITIGHVFFWVASLLFVIVAIGLIHSSIGKRDSNSMIALAVITPLVLLILYPLAIHLYDWEFLQIGFLYEAFS